ncbi:MAG: hypothetical protein KJP00_08150 [Bacteroidia bacterium]|nr:hypothetical protein [Bacteroidia bacterium]
MQSTTEVLALFWGWFMIIVALILLFSRKAKENLLKSTQDSGIEMIFGFLTMMIGLIQVIVHSHWDGYLETIVSVIGCIALVKGISLLAFPKFILGVAKVLGGRFLPVSLIVMLAFGVYLVTSVYGLV